MDIKDVKAIREVIEDGSISKAASKLFVTPQALSKTVQRVESELGIELFERNVTGMIPTVNGRTFYEKSEQLIQDFLALDNLFASNLNCKTGKLNLAAALGVIALFSPEIVFEFNDLYPNFKIYITENTDNNVDQMVENKEADIGIAIAPVDTAVFDHVSLIKVPHCLLVHKDHPLSQKQSIDIMDLKGEKVTLESREFKVYRKFMKLCGDAGFEPDLYFETTEIHFAHQLASEGKCLSVSVMSEVIHNLHPDLRVKPFSMPFEWEICLIKRKREPLGEIQKAFRGYLTDKIPGINERLKPFQR